MYVSLPASSSLQRTNETCKQIEGILNRYESLQFVTPIVGYAFVTGAYQSNVATYFVMAKEWNERDADGRADNGSILIGILQKK